MTDILDVQVMLSNFEGRDRVSLKEFIGYASMIVEEDAFNEGIHDAEVTAEQKRALTDEPE